MPITVNFKFSKDHSALRVTVACKSMCKDSDTYSAYSSVSGRHSLIGPDSTLLEAKLSQWYVTAYRCFFAIDAVTFLKFLTQSLKILCLSSYLIFHEGSNFTDATRIVDHESLGIKFFDGYSSLKNWCSIMRCFKNEVTLQ